ncbi:hypothetical protein CCUS01_09828 [Colletotrichum cuscutae]|uniref:Uncharacterized protein n=1 Tax=Colletotrichum cuscutae TaxID=1209917 RepID=A0AAI9XQX7_9PEZI|nr:hypothetical protein CCUS01_09828 [Colletotrichum cuscutae]
MVVGKGNRRRRGGGCAAVLDGPFPPFYMTGDEPGPPCGGWQRRQRPVPVRLCAWPGGPFVGGSFLGPHGAEPVDEMRSGSMEKGLETSKVDEGWTTGIESGSWSERASKQAQEAQMGGGGMGWKVKRNGRQEPLNKQYKPDMREPIPVGDDDQGRKGDLALGADLMRIGRRSGGWERGCVADKDGVIWRKNRTMYGNWCVPGWTTARLTWLMGVKAKVERSSTGYGVCTGFTVGRGEVEVAKGTSRTDVSFSRFLFELQKVEPSIGGEMEARILAGRCDSINDPKVRIHDIRTWYVRVPLICTLARVGKWADSFLALLPQRQTETQAVGLREQGQMNGGGMKAAGNRPRSKWQAGRVEQTPTTVHPFGKPRPNKSKKNRKGPFGANAWWSPKNSAEWTEAFYMRRPGLLVDHPAFSSFDLLVDGIMAMLPPGIFVFGDERDRGWVSRRSTSSGIVILFARTRNKSKTEERRKVRQEERTGMASRKQGPDGKEVDDLRELQREKARQSSERKAGAYLT